MVTAERINVLLVEDEPADFFLFKTFLRERLPEYQLTWARTYEDALTFIDKKEHDIYFFDYRLGAYTGIDLIQYCKESGVTAPVIMLTGMGNVETDMKAMELGASDYLVKGEIDPGKLERTIRYSIEQNRMLKKLKTSEAKFRSIFENSYDVIYVSDMIGNVIDINKSGQRVFGYTHEELLQLNLTELCFDPNDRLAFLNAITDGSNSNFEVTLRDKEGNQKHCILTSSILKTDEHKQEFYQGIIHDMTKRKKTERDLIAAEKLAITGKIARMLAHEVRNPLTSINLSVEQLEYSIEDESFTPYFEIIKRNSKRINGLVTELLESSKPAELSEIAVNLNTILNSTLELTRDRAKLKNIQIITQFGSDEDKIMADGSKLTIAFLNIVTNAIEAVKENTGVIKITSGSVGNNCFVSIQDNGCGIPDEHLSKVFDPYFTSKPNGMGLGLATCFNIIKIHNGKIDLVTELNKGTTFTIVLQRVQENLQSAGA